MASVWPRLIQSDLEKKLFLPTNQIIGEVIHLKIGEKSKRVFLLFKLRTYLLPLRFYQSGEMVVVAKKMIHKGEEITNNYGIHHNNLVRGINPLKMFCVFIGVPRNTG